MFRTALAALASAAAMAQSRNVEFSNTAKPAGKGYYEWSVFVRSSDPSPGQIRCVVYTLHQTFENPVRRECDPKTRFAHTTGGWGEFTILARVEWMDRSVTNHSYDLRLFNPPPARAPVARRTQFKSGNTARQIARDRWRWTIYLSGAPSAISRVRMVTYYLHPSFPNPVVTVADPGKSPDFAFPFTAEGWGTFAVGIRLTLDDNSTIELPAHQLSFDR
jgi:transcription initiation factor IIF auxiliary subunit